MLDALKQFFINEALNQFLPYIISGAIVWFGTLYQRWTGKQLEARHREALQSALENGVRGAIQKVLAGKLSADGTIPAEKRGLVLEAAADYVKGSVPSAVKKFKLTNRKLVDLLEPKLPLSIDKK